MEGPLKALFSLRIFKTRPLLVFSEKRKQAGERVKTDGEEEKRVSMGNNNREEGGRGKEKESLRSRTERDGARTERIKTECIKQAAAEKESQ